MGTGMDASSARSLLARSGDADIKARLKEETEEALRRWGSLPVSKLQRHSVQAELKMGGMNVSMHILRCPCSVYNRFVFPRILVPAHKKQIVGFQWNLWVTTSAVDFGSLRASDVLPCGAAPELLNTMACCVTKLFWHFGYSISLLAILSTVSRFATGICPS